MIDVFIGGKGNVVQNYYNWMLEGSLPTVVLKVIFTGIWITALLTFNFFYTFLIFVLAHSVREFYIGMQYQSQNAGQGSNKYIDMLTADKENEFE